MIAGAGGSAVPPAPGPCGAPYPWQSAAGGVNTANGNKMVSLPLVGWTARGGLPVGFGLTWNSQGDPNNYLNAGPKWSASYNVTLSADGSGNMTVLWGDGRSYTFFKNSDGTYTPPKGIYDTLAPSNGSFALKTKSQITYQFGWWGASAHFLTGITDENGNTVSVARDGSARVQKVTDPTGRTITLAYDGSGRLNSVRDDQTGRSWTLAYDGGGNLAYVYWPAINGGTPSIHMTYDQSHNLHEFDDLNGHYAWGANYQTGNVLQNEVDAVGNYTAFTYSGGQTTVTDPNNHATVYNYAGSTLTSVTDATNKTEYYGYDSNNNLTSKTDRRGQTWTYGVDTPHGNATGIRDPLKLDGLVATTYDARNSKTLQSTDANGNSTTYVYDPGGVNLLATTDALGHTSTVNGYSYGLPTGVTDPLGHTSTLGYDGDGNLIQATDPNGNSSSATYNRLGWKLTSTDGLGQTTGYFYDNWGRVTSVDALPTAGVPFYRLVSADGNHSFLTQSQSEFNGYRTSGWWNPVGPVGGIYANSTDAPGTVALYRMRENGAGDCDYTTSQSLYNTATTPQPTGWGYTGEGVCGYVYTSPAPGRKPIYYAWLSGVRDFFTDNQAEYNALPAPWNKNGVAWYLVSNTVSTTYDNNSNVLTVTDQNGHTVTNTYDADNRLLTTQKGNGDTVSYTYDADATRRGLLVYKTDGNGNSLGYAYTPRNELAQIGYPDGTNEFFSYDEDGSLYKHTAQDTNVTTYTYDNDDRPGQVFSPDPRVNPTITYGYDAAGRQTSLQDGTGTTSWNYDNGNRLTQITSPNGTVGYGYDDAGRRTSLTLAGQYTINYYYDNGGRMTSLFNGLGNSFDFSYDAADRLYTRNNRQGVRTSYALNSAGLPTQITSAQGEGSGGTINTDSYTYDPAGNRLVNNSYDGWTAYSYDGADQLTVETHNGTTTGYTYDHNGNRLTKVLNGQTDTYAYQPNQSNGQLHTDRLLSVTGGITGSKTFGYDPEGNVRSITTNGSTVWFSTDYNDKVTRADFNTGPGQGTVFSTYRYNAQGLRTFYHSADGQDHPAVCDGTSPGSPLLESGPRLFTPGLSWQQSGQGQHFFDLDALGSVRGFTDNAQNPNGEIYYDAFGNASLRQGVLPGPLGFAGALGYQTDADTGLLLLGNRYYDPTIGRFLSMDPAKSGMNWYAYCNNNPTSYVDPTGLKKTDDPTDPTPDQIQQIEDAIQLMRDSGYGTEANNVQQLLDSNRLKVDHGTDPAEPQTEAYTPFTISRNQVTIHIYSFVFSNNYSSAPPSAAFGERARISGLLVHEGVHAFKQGFWSKLLYPSAIEPHAYGAQVRYLRGLYNKYTNLGKRAALEALIENLAIPTGKSFSDKLDDAADAVANGIDNGN